MLWVVKKAKLRKAKKICLQGGKRGISLRWHAFLHLKSDLIGYLAKVQHDVVWTWLPSVNKRVYSMDIPYFNFKFRHKLPPESGELCFQGSDQWAGKGESCIQSSRVSYFGLRTSLPFKNASHWLITETLQKLIEKWMLCLYVGVCYIKPHSVLLTALSSASESTHKTSQLKNCFVSQTYLFKKHEESSVE